MAMNGDRKTNIFGKLVRFGKLGRGEEGEREVVVGRSRTRSKTGWFLLALASYLAFCLYCCDQPESGNRNWVI